MSVQLDTGATRGALVTQARVAAYTHTHTQAGTAQQTNRQSQLNNDIEINTKETNNNRVILQLIKHQGDIDQAQTIKTSGRSQLILAFYYL